PKQPAIKPDQVGNWLRLPGFHHTRWHWSRVWGGDGWLAGNAAIDFMLSLTGDPATLVPEVPSPSPAHQRQIRTAPGGNLSARIAAYMAKLPHLGEGQGRDDVAYRFAAFLVRDLALDGATALDWLCLWDEGNRPPKGRSRLAEIMAN